MTVGLKIKAEAGERHGRGGEKPEEIYPTNPEIHSYDVLYQYLRRKRSHGQKIIDKHDPEPNGEKE
jgi:hypothetical protein